MCKDTTILSNISTFKIFTIKFSQISIIFTKFANNKATSLRLKEMKQLIYAIIFMPVLMVLACAASGCGSDAHHTPNAKADLEWVWDESPNPYDQHLPAMPDDGCIKLSIRNIGPLAKVFNDSNYLHYEAGEALGIEPIEDISQAWLPTRPLQKIMSCREYFVDTLTHSYPYLVPEAAALLGEIGKRFNDTLAARGGGSYRLKVTSVLRTPRLVKRLRRINRNSVDSSAHKFATTFDISYAKFICDSLTVNRTQEDLKNLLGEILYDLRNENLCWVKHERKQGCFHITARK